MEKEESMIHNEKNKSVTDKLQIAKLAYKDVNIGIIG